MDTFAGTDIAKEIYKGFKGKTAQLKYIEKTDTYDPLNPGSGSSSSVPYSCEGFIDNYSAFNIKLGIVKAGDKKGLIFAESLSAVPEVGQQIKDHNGVYYDIISIDPDPANAVYDIQLR